MIYLRDFWRENQREVLLFILIFGLVSASFAIGYLSASEWQATPIIIEKNNQTL